VVVAVCAAPVAVCVAVFLGVDDARAVAVVAALAVAQAVRADVDVCVVAV
jgi:hypothetical protein